MRMNFQSSICEGIAIELQSESNFVAKALPPRVSTDKVAEQFDLVQQIDVRLPRSADIRGLRRSWWLAPHPSWLALATSAQDVAALHICSFVHLHICCFVHLHICCSAHLHICSLQSAHLRSRIWSLHIIGKPGRKVHHQAKWHCFPWPNVIFLGWHWKVTITRSSWLNCALQGDEAVYWVSIGHYETVAVRNWWYWVSRGIYAIIYWTKWRSRQVLL